MDGLLILGIETATSCGSVSLSRGAVTNFHLLTECIAQPNVTHSRRLMGSVQWAMEAAGVQGQDIDGIGVSIGPGSFTGLRIGLAAAKAIALASGKPLLGVSTLQALALSCQGVAGDRTVGVLLDARKKEVYAGFYRFVDQGKIVPVRDPEVIDPHALLNRLKEPVLLAGPGVDVYQEIFAGRKHIDLFPGYLAAPRASFVGMLAAQMLAEEQSDDPATIAPVYVRASEAELNLQKSQA